ncbi:MAG: ABC transporter permease [Oscillospiraceae bacterium]|nr:ABC transporter permease [Oscillospiraceae bacterium]
MSKYTGVVLRKELKDTFRDKKTVYLGMLLPLVLYPLLFWFMGRGAAQFDQAGATVALYGMNNAPAVQAFLTDTVFADFEEIDVVDSDDPLQDLLDGNVNVVMRMDDNAAAALLAGEQADIQLMYNNTRTASQVGVATVQGTLYAYNQIVVAQRLYSEHGVSLDDLSPLVILPNERYSDAEGEANDFLSMMVPMLLLIMLAVGSMASAVDMFAGEKERKTLEPLLTTRAGRGSILTGKFLAVSMIGFLTTIITLVGMFLGFYINADTMMGEGGGFGGLLEIPIPALLLSLLLVVAVQMSFTAIHVILSAWSKNVKEASTYGSMVMVAAMIPAYATMFMAAGDVPRWMMYVPFVNVAGALKMLLGGFHDYAMVGIALASSAVFLFVLLWVTTRMFKKEEIMLRM